MWSSNFGGLKPAHAVLFAATLATRLAGGSFASHDQSDSISVARTRPICWGSTLVLRFVVWQIKSDAPRSPPPPSTYKQTPKPHVNHEIFMTSSLILTVLDPNLIGSCAQPHPRTSKWCSVVTSVCNVQSLCFTKRFHKQHCLLLFMVLLPGISVYHVPTSKHLPLQQNNNQTETMVKKALI